MLVLDHLPIKTLNPFNFHIRISYHTYFGGLESLVNCYKINFKQFNLMMVSTILSIVEVVDLQ